MYPAELKIKGTTESISSSYLDLLMSIWRYCRLRTSIYDKRDNFNFNVTYCPFLSINISIFFDLWLFISQLIRYARACSSYGCIILRARRHSSKPLKHKYLMERLQSSFRKFYVYDLIHQFEVSLKNVKWHSYPYQLQRLPNWSGFPLKAPVTYSRRPCVR